MSFGGPYSELNKRMRESREESKRRRERRNKFKESAGIQSASSEQNPEDISSRILLGKMRSAFLKKFNINRLESFAIFVSLINNQFNQLFRIEVIFN